MKVPSIFNCSNDMALAANVRQYLPPKRIQQMESDLADLASYWEDTMFAGPWGWSIATKQHYVHNGMDAALLPSDDYLQLHRKLSSREFACHYLHQLLDTFKGERLLGNEMQFVTDFQSLSSVNIQTRQDAQDENVHPQIYKSPWSSSGRGVFVSDKMDDATQRRLQGFLNTQGGFVVDKFHTDKRLDFAMEFFVHEDHAVEFLGYSVFNAASNGAYGYNIVASQEELMTHIHTDSTLLQRLIDYHLSHLGNIGYHGPVGIDMIETDGNLHPVIEINLRMNMGILAIVLYNTYGDNANVQLTPKREQGFEAVINEGKLQITYSQPLIVKR